MMKQFFYLFIILISSLTYGQTKFYVHLDAETTVDRVSISSFNLSKKFTSEVKNGIAIVDIPSISSDQYSISVADKKRVAGWFNTGKIDIYLAYKDDKLSILKTQNAPIYERQVKYFKEYRSFLKDRSGGAEFIKNTILENDQDAFVLVPLNHYLKLYQNDNNELTFIENFLNNQPLSTKQHSIYTMISDRIKKLKSKNKVDIQKYVFVTVDGKKSAINIDPKFKYTVLDFWFTACPPCVKEHDQILANSNIFNDLDAELIGVSIDEKQEKWTKYLAKKNINWKNYRIGEMNLSKDLGIWSFPTYLILDKENNIVGSYSNIEDTMKALKK